MGGGFDVGHSIMAVVRVVGTEDVGELHQEETSLVGVLPGDAGAAGHDLLPDLECLGAWWGHLDLEG